MDRERLSELLQDPSQVAKQDLQDLRSMSERFPWFSGAHLLLAVGEHETGDVLANDRRSQPAAYLPSRSVLFDLVHKQVQAEPSSLRLVKDEEPVVGPMRVNDPPTAPAQGAAGTLHPLPAVYQDKEVPAEVTLVPLETSSIPTGIEAEEALEAKEAVKEVPEPTRPDTERELLDRQIVEAVQASGYNLAQLGSIDPAQEEPLPIEHVLPREPVHSIPVPSAVIHSPAPDPEFRMVRPAPGPNARLRFTDWLVQEATAPTEETPSLAPPLPEVATDPRSATPSPAPAAMNQKEIMDHFIQHSSPAPAAKKAVFFTPQQAAKKSLQDDGLVSETLARIHEKQGNFSKAREVYDRLAVKHPEKSVYFAALSKALEGRSNK